MACIVGFVVGLAARPYIITHVSVPLFEIYSERKTVGMKTVAFYL